MSNLFALVYKLKSKLKTFSGGTKQSQGYISAKETVANASALNLGVCDYLEKIWGIEGNTEKTIVTILGFIEAEHLDSIVELGPGTGRYTGKLLERSGVSPIRHELYETAIDWREYLKVAYQVECHEADGFTMHQSKSFSAGLIHAHGVFVYLSLLNSYSYFKEIWRVSRPKGYVVFDMYTEDCMDEKALEKWLASINRYPSILPRQFVIDLFSHHGFSLKGSFKHRHGEGLSEYLIFQNSN